jgi:hypothetical protein
MVNESVKHILEQTNKKEEKAKKENDYMKAMLGVKSKDKKPKKPSDENKYMKTMLGIK